MSSGDRLRHHLDLTLAAVKAAPPHTIAYKEAVRALREATTEIDRIATEQAAARAASGKTSEQWASEQQADAAQATSEDLEIYVAEYYRRIKVRPVHHHDGRIELVRVQASA